MKINNDKLFDEIADLLARGRDVTITVRGGSMRPLLVDGRDRVTLRRPQPGGIRRGDVVLVRESGGGGVVLHRVVRRSGDSLVLQGDGNRVQTETAAVADVVGVAVSFTRRGKTCSSRALSWRLLSLLMLVFVSWRRLYIRFRVDAGYVRGVSAGRRRGIMLSCVVGVVSVALSLAFIYFTKRVIDVATSAAVGGLVAGIAVLGALIVAQLLCDVVASFVSVRLQLGVGNALRHRLLVRLLQSRWSMLARFHTGDIVNRVERDASSVVGLLTVSLPSMVVTAVQLVAALAFFCWLDAWLPWLVLAVLVVLLPLGRVYVGKMYGYTRQMRQSDSRIQAVIQESLQQHTVVKALEQGAGRVGALDGHQAALYRQFMRRTRFSVASRSVVSAAFALGYLAVFAWGAYRLSVGDITFGTMAAFLQLVGKVQQPVLDLARMLPSLVEVFTAVDRLREIEEMPSEDTSRRKLFAAVPDVVFSDVTFGYSGDGRPVLSRFTHTFRAGTSTAVVGHTGRGKTTLIRLLLALVSPQQGRAWLDDGNVRAELSADTRCNFTYVPQGNTLFSGTIRDNLLMGNPEATDDDMRRALRAAEADFVFAMPGALDAALGEQGGGLSEGQAQRVAIARALLRPGNILLFDEATSALDVDTERRLLLNLRTHCAGKTIIFVTHHKAVADACDCVVRL